MLTTQLTLPGTETFGYLTQDEAGRPFVAVQVDDEGRPEDYCYNWETAENFGAEHRMIALADDGHMSRETIQALCDQARAAYLDCFGS